MRRILWTSILIGLIAIGMVVSGCAGREPNPVALYQYGDEKKPCPHLKAEISELQSDIQRKIKKCDNTQGKNVALGVTGAILFWPALFFMDLSDADQVELEALRKRHNALVRLCIDKKCGFDYQEMAKIKPEVSEDGKRPEPVLAEE